MRLIATSTYQRDAKRLLKGYEQASMEQAIADDPYAHPVIPGTSGVRKARWARQGRGKSGGVRVIYYHLVIGAEIHLLALYAKNEQADLDAAGKKKAKQYVEELKRAKKNQSK